MWRINAWLILQPHSRKRTGTVNFQQGVDTFTQKAVVKLLTGELEATAESPVKWESDMLK
ncbi:MAG: hypothetical protein MJZ00_01325 [Paludibacteraceae bacterium]|nr:hypothetical protein [Paludibacteraceae bacterium]